MSNVKNRRKSGDSGSSFMLICLCLAGLIAVYKRIALTNLIGDNGNAYFGMAYDTFLFLFLMTGYSIQNVLAKTVAARYSVGQFRNAKRVWNTAFVLVVIMGTAAAGLQYIMADFLGKAIFESPQAVPAIEYMAPLLLVSSVLGLFRGYFQGMGTAVPTAISRIIEECVGAGLLFYMTGRTMEEGSAIGNLLQNGEYENAFGAGGAGLALTAGCVAAIGFLVLLYSVFQNNFKRWVRKDNGKEVESRNRILNALMGGMAPVILMGLVLYGSYILDQLLYFIILPDSPVKIAEWGIYTGKYRILAGIPVSVMGFICITIMPEAGGNRKNRQILFVIRTAFLTALPMAVYLGIMSGTLIPALFQSGDLQAVAGWLRAGSAAVLLQALGIAFTCVLCGTGRLKAVLVSAGSSIAVHIICMLVFLSKLQLGIQGVVYSNLVLYGIFAVMNLIFIIMDMSVKPDWAHLIGTPVISTAVTGLVVFFMNTLLSGKVADGALVFLTAFVGAVLYLVMVLMLHGISEKDARKLPFGKIVIIMGKTLHFM